MRRSAGPSDRLGLGRFPHGRGSLRGPDGFKSPHKLAEHGWDAYDEDRAGLGFTWRVVSARLMLDKKDGAKEVPMDGLLVISTLTILRILLPLGLLLLLGTIAERQHNRALRTG